MSTYTYEDGVYTFHHEHCQLQVSQIDVDRHGRMYGTVALLTPDGEAYLAQDWGDIQSGLFQNRLASQAARRNSGDSMVIENIIFDAALALGTEALLSSSAAAAPSFQILSDFMDQAHPDGEDVVQGLLERGECYSMASKPKVGKSLLLMDLAVAVATGEPWLGRQTTKGRVCFFQLEDSEKIIHRRLSKRLGGRRLSNVFLHMTPFRLTQENFEVTVTACLGSSLIICDPIIQASEVRDWNSQSEVRDAYDIWRRLARDTGAAVVVSAHHRKMVGTYGDQIGGSIQAQAAVDGMIEVYRDTALDKMERKVSFTGRSWSDMDDEVIRLDIETLTWKSSGFFKDVKENAKAGTLQRESQALLDALPVKEPGKTYQELQQETGLTKDRLRNIVKDLGEKVIRTDLSGGNSGRRAYFRRAE